MCSVLKKVLEYRSPLYRSTGIRFKKVVFEYSFYDTQEKLFLKHTTRTFRFFQKFLKKMLSVFWVFAALYRQPLTYHKQNKKPDSLQRYSLLQKFSTVLLHFTTAVVLLVPSTPALLVNLLVITHPHYYRYLGTRI